jgi:hypothetical protein
MLDALDGEEQFVRMRLGSPAELAAVVSRHRVERAT